MKAQGHITVRRRPKDGDNGSNAFRLDLNNENDSLLYDAEGNLLSGSVVSVATLYDGDAAVSSGVVFAISERVGCTAAQATISGNTITVSGLSGSGYVMVTATYNNKTYSAKFTLKRLVGTVKYDLLVTPDAIAYNTTTGTKSASTINVKIYRTAQNNSGGVSRTLMTSVPTGHTLKVDGTNVANYGSSGYTFNVNTSQNSHVVSLYQSSTLVDEETVPINKSTNGSNGKDGQNGQDGKGIKSTVVMYQASNSGTTTPTGTWQYNIPSVTAGNYLWTRTVITYTDDTTSTSYSVTRFGVDGQNGATGPQGPTGSTGPQGPQGIAGCLVRLTAWESGREYRNDSALTSGTRYIDIVIDKPLSLGTSGVSAYLCTTTHTASASTKPGEGSSWSAYWQKMNSFAPVITPLIFTQALTADYINVADLVANSALIAYLNASNIKAKEIETVESGSGHLYMSGNEMQMFNSNGQERMKVHGGELSSLVAYTDTSPSSAQSDNTQGTTYYDATGQKVYEKTKTIVTKSISQARILTLPALPVSVSLSLHRQSSQSDTIYVMCKAEYLVDDNTVKSAMQLFQLNYSNNSALVTLTIPMSNVNVAAGSHTVKVKLTVDIMNIGTLASNEYVYHYVNYTVAKDSISWATSIMKTEIANNGFRVALSSTCYVLVNLTTGGDDMIVFRNGNIVLRVTNSAIQKSTDGGTNWTNL